jgi:hypothetical protein
MVGTSPEMGTAELAPPSPTEVIALVVMMKMTDQLETPRGRYDEHSNKFPSVRNRGFIVQEKVNTPEGDAC